MRDSAVSTNRIEVLPAEAWLARQRANAGGDAILSVHVFESHVILVTKCFS
jgi:hypothetical protein